MPVHARDKKEAGGGPPGREDMELEFGEPEGSSGSEEEEDEDEESPGSSGSDGGESEEMDDEDCERRRMECLDEMSNLEKQFTDLKDQLYKERLNQVDFKLQEVSAGKGPEYLEPLATLQDNMQIRTKVAGIYRELCLESVKNKYDCEIQAARQHCESEKLLLFDTVQSELEEKIRRLEEDRHSIDITSELWNDEIQSRKKRRDPFSPDKKKKPMVVSGPYIVYMLQDLDILEDWTSIRKAMATLGPHRVKAEDLVEASLRSPGASPRHCSVRGLAVSVVPSSPPSTMTRFGSRGRMGANRSCTSHSCRRGSTRSSTCDSHLVATGSVACSWRIDEVLAAEHAPDTRLPFTVTCCTACAMIVLVMCRSLCVGIYCVSCSVAPSEHLMA
ncbi:breast cancer metastasis-suppressor 1-like protein isoform X2 [Pleurodeles waltl]|uniref:breast cancer metastasis-suppressor 1-like protein isoform X2 n=1 Tax=Pleurodeles waltl TaxID=8319 RepID=UPI0037098CE8